MKYNHFLPHTEWESFNFPIQLLYLECKNGYYNIPKNSVINIWRDQDFKLRANISGIIASKDELEYKNPLQDTHFVTTEIITCTSMEHLFHYELKGCFIGNITYTPVSIEPIAQKFQAELRLSEITKFFATKYETKILTEWYICGKMNVIFPRSTKRKFDEKIYRIRESVDVSENHGLVKSSGMSNDFILVDANNLKFIISQVPDEFIPECSKTAIAIEYRTEFADIPIENIREAISEIVSFVFGTQLLSIGYSEYSDNNEVVRQVGISPWGDSIRVKCNKNAMPPMNINNYNEWRKIEDIFNTLIPQYLLLREKLNLKNVIWRYWIALDLSIGTNLPILSSALENLAEAHLKSLEPKISSAYMEQKVFEELISNEIIEIEKKLEGKAFGAKIINKIKGSVWKGSNEKIEMFFAEIQIVKSKIENDALKARNKMVHSSFDSNDDDELKKVVKLTRAYETLFNRVLLKILDYKGKYIDYHTFGHPERELSESIE